MFCRETGTKDEEEDVDALEILVGNIVATDIAVIPRVMTVGYDSESLYYVFFDSKL